MDIEKIKKQARVELEAEEFRKEVDKCKQKLREANNFWDKIFPFKILIIRKEY